eukprot:Skav222570  [mRNA]  locus=scaffold791:199075:208837:+ [translate_table: standard]
MCGVVHSGRCEGQRRRLHALRLPEPDRKEDSFTRQTLDHEVPREQILSLLNDFRMAMDELLEFPEQVGSQAAKGTVERHQGRDDSTVSEIAHGAAIILCAARDSLCEIPWVRARARLVAPQCGNLELYEALTSARVRTMMLRSDPVSMAQIIARPDAYAVEHQGQQAGEFGDPAEEQRRRMENIGGSIGGEIPRIASLAAIIVIFGQKRSGGAACHGDLQILREKFCLDLAELTEIRLAVDIAGAAQAVEAISWKDVTEPAPEPSEPWGDAPSAEAHGEGLEESGLGALGQRPERDPGECLAHRDLGDGERCRVPAGGIGRPWDLAYRCRLVVIVAPEIQKCSALVAEQHQDGPSFTESLGQQQRGAFAFAGQADGLEHRS